MGIREEEKKRRQEDPGLAQTAYAKEVGKKQEDTDG